MKRRSRGQVVLLRQRPDRSASSTHGPSLLGRLLVPLMRDVPTTEVAQRPVNGLPSQCASPSVFPKVDFKVLETTPLENPRELDPASRTIRNSSSTS